MPRDRRRRQQHQGKGRRVRRVQLVLLEVDGEPLRRRVLPDQHRLLNTRQTDRQREREREKQVLGIIENELIEREEGVGGFHFFRKNKEEIERKKTASERAPPRDNTK